MEVLAVGFRGWVGLVLVLVWSPVMRSLGSPVACTLPRQSAPPFTFAGSSAGSRAVASWQPGGGQLLFDLLLHHHHCIKKQKEKGKENEMTRMRRWGADLEEEHLDLLPALEKTLEPGAEARRRRQRAGGGGASIRIMRWEHGEDTPIPNLLSL